MAADGKTAVIDCAPLKRNELPKTVRAMAAGHGVTLTEGAARALVDLVGENTVHLDSELKKIALAHRGTDAVNEHEIMGLVARTAEVKPWEFVDALAARDARKCLLLLGRMESVIRPTPCWPCARRACASWCAPAPWPTAATRAAWPQPSRYPTGAARTMSPGPAASPPPSCVAPSSPARDTERAMKSGADAQAAFLDWVLSVTAR